MLLRNFVAINMTTFHKVLNWILDICQLLTNSLESREYDKISRFAEVTMERKWYRKVGLQVCMHAGTSMRDRRHIVTDNELELGHLHAHMVWLVF